MGRTTRACLALLVLAGCRRDEPDAAALTARVDQLERRLTALESTTAERSPAAAAPEPRPADQERPSTPGPALEPVLAKHGRGDPVHLALAVDGTVRLEGVVLAPAEIDATMRALAGTDAVARVEIAAADGVPHADLVALMDRVRDAGLSRFAIVARGGDEPSPEPE